MQKNTVNNTVDTVIRRRSQIGGSIQSESKSSKGVLQEILKSKKQSNGTRSINLSINRSLKDFKEFKKNKSSKQNSSNEVVEYYNNVLDSLNKDLYFSFKKVPLCRVNDELRDINTVIVFNGNSFEKKDPKQLVKGSIIKVINSMNTLLEEEEFEISSFISDIEIKSSHKTDEILLIFSLKKNVLKDDINLKQITSSLKTVVFRLRDLGNVVSSVFLKQDNGGYLKITGSDRIRESIADISIELKPSSFFEKNPEQTFVLCRRFEQLLSDNLGIDSNTNSKDKNTSKNKDKSKKKDKSFDIKNNYILWDINCRYGLVTLVALRSGWKTFSVITDNSKSDEIYNNIDINKDISGSILDQKSEYIISSSPSDIVVPKDRISPQAIILKLDEGFDLSDKFIHFLTTAMLQKKYSRLFVYTLSVESLKKVTLKLKEYGILLRQVEGTEIIPNDKNEICYLGIFTKSLNQEQNNKKNQEQL